jgi:primary-amine oxidase
MATRWTVMETSLARCVARLRAHVLVACCAWLALAGPLGAHPLDPLTWQEHWAALKVLAAEKKIDADTRFARLALRPPDKQAVWGWSAGQAFERAAEVVIKQGRRTFEAVVDLRAGKLASWTEMAGAQVPWLEEEYQSEALDRVMEDPRFQRAMKKRGVDRPEFLECAVNPHANLGEAEYQGRRVGVVTCNRRTDVRNAAPRAIEGLYILVDVNTGDVLEFNDETVTAQGLAAEYDLGSTKNLRDFAAPIEIHQPAGPGFKISGNSIEWDRWRFHLRSDQRTGLIISTVVWDDGTRRRPVLYEGHLSEIFVPYMAPQQSWASRTHLDVGENSAGGLSQSLEPGVHCPANAVYFDAIVVQDNGWPKDKRRVVCLFERYGGEVAWLHEEEGRQKRVLVARMSALAGNYDYLIDWTFQTDGEIRVTVGATGIIGVRTVAKRNATESGAEGGELHGRYVADHLVGVNHSHFFNFRFDLDVDGPDNAFQIDKITMAPLPKGHPRRAVWVSQSHAAEREHDVLEHGHEGAALLRVASAAAKNSQGYPTSYQLLPSHPAHALFMPEEDVARRRAGFINHNVWVTPYNVDERYAAGKYATLSKPGEGLPQWTRENRPIKDRDIVLWYTIGMHHVVRAEDWPVMPVVQHSISLRPFDFFDRNPAIDTGTKP